MRERAEIAVSAADKLENFASLQRDNPVLVGFDGFVDSIITVVDQRLDGDEFIACPTIERFARKVDAAAGKSANYELHVKMRKLGGNGPIMANALLQSGHPTIYMGALGKDNIDPVFADFAHHAEVLSVCDPAYTDALEFEDGKLMLGKLQSMGEVTIQNFLETFGKAHIQQVIDRARLIGCTNWTMLPHMNGIWEYLIEEVLPEAREPQGGPRIVFADLADPEKRTPESLVEALRLFARFNQYAKAVLGLNLKESIQVTEALGLTLPSNPEVDIETIALQIREELGLSGVVVHPRASAACALKFDDEVKSALFMGPLVKKPKLSTGAGDNFNAGFCLGLMAGLDEHEALACGTGTSGFYVRSAASPQIIELVEFLKDLPAPQTATV